MHQNLPYRSKSVDIDALRCFHGSRLPEILETVAEVRPDDHLLHLKCMELIQDLLVRFMKTEILLKPNRKFIVVNELLE